VSPATGYQRIINYNEEDVKRKRQEERRQKKGSNLPKQYGFHVEHNGLIFEDEEDLRDYLEQ